MEETIQSTKSNWMPKMWVAILLCLFASPLAMFYLGRKAWALIYFILLIVVAVIRFTLFIDYTDEVLWWLPFIIPLISAAHAYYMVPHINEPRKWYSRWYGLIGIFLVFIVPVLIFRAFFYEHFRQASGSMLPTMKAQQLVNVQKWGCGNYQFLGIQFYMTQPSQSCQILRGDLIVFEFPSNPKDLYIKRVIAIGGDHFKYIDKKVMLNGQLIQSEWVKTSARNDYFQETIGEKSYQVLNFKGVNHNFRHIDVEVPQGFLFVLGDNRDNSSDSRSWGLVPIENVVGKLLLED